MRVCLEINTGNNPARHRQALPTDRVSINGNRGLDRWDVTQLQGRCSVEKLGFVNGEHREIAVVRNIKNLRRIGLRITFFIDRKKTHIADHMGIGEDSVALNNKPRAHSGRDVAGAPRRFVIGLLGCRLDAHKAFSDLGGMKSSCKENTEKKK